MDYTAKVSLHPFLGTDFTKLFVEL